jgi:NADPH:quinone reductase-like Zn-dependent oxidoreductase
MAMKAWQITEPTGPSGLRLNEIPTPEPNPGEVLVRMRAVSLNFRDLSATRMERPGNLPMPFTVCSDGAGEVAAVGGGVVKWKVGDLVMPAFFQDWPAGGMTREVMKSALGGARQGVLAEYAIASAEGLVRMPRDWSFEQGATLPCAAVTAWNALVGHGHLKAGETVLALGTGGVSMFALQIAKIHGARVIITSSSDEKLAKAKALGADEGINYRTTPDWERSVFELTGKKGVDHVVEVGGAGTLQKSLDAVCYGGRVSLIGVLTGFGGNVNPWPITARSISLQGIYVGSRVLFEEMVNAFELNGVQPVVDRVFAVDQAREAFDLMAAGGHLGKIVVRL